MKKLVIIGAGGFGREVAWQVMEQKEFCSQYQLMGFVDDNESLAGTSLNGLPVLGTMEWLIKQEESIAVLVAVGSAKVRKMIVERCRKNKNLYFPTFIANDVALSDTVKIGEGGIICRGNILTVNITIGDFTLINLSCTIGHDVVMEDYVTVYPGVHVSGNVSIGGITEIGTGTNIIQGKSIGSHVIVGAGSVVIRDIGENCTAVGVPAKVVKEKLGRKS